MDEKKELLKEKLIAFKKAHEELVDAAENISRELMYEAEGLLDDDSFFDFKYELGLVEEDEE